jgi:hypothetical protein
MLTAVYDLIVALHGAFTPRPGTGWVMLTLLGSAATVALLLRAFGAERRRRARWTLLNLFAEEKKLSADETLALRTLGRNTGVDPLTVATRVHLFERATGRALAGLTPTIPLSEDDVFSLTERLRIKLGFSRLPPNFPLLTSRELQDGFPVDVLEQSGQVVEVNEGFFVVELPGAFGISAGVDLPLTVHHRGEAQYELRCKVLSVEPTPLVGSTVCFLHCESPLRIQDRASVRVDARGPVLVAMAEAEAVSAELVNVSIGGLLAESRHALTAGGDVRLSFDLGDAKFKRVPAVLLSSVRRREHAHSLHFAFTEIGEGQRNRLSAWIARATSRQLT